VKKPSHNAEAALEELRETARQVCEGASEIEDIAGLGFTVPGFLLQRLDALLPPRTQADLSDGQINKEEKK